MDPETRGERAKQILDNEVYQDAVKDARQRIKDKWEIATSDAEREALWHRLRAIDAVTEELRIISGNAAVIRDRRLKEVRSA